ncbi:hypothetical protein MKZ38_001035 [Zalerion maritima]|uniref:Aminoglycoside phosphotransferase domain-containing protein n=1 Tax=Zalerion maritima TaxID=339359 RepID=A0AAD5WTK3_9PEZI|nr:hypothetical protein MKZ38_001035 [Zalerion maritima]
MEELLIEHPASSLSTEENDSLEMFSEVLSTLDKEQIPRLAKTILQRLQPDNSASNTTPTIDEPMHGSCHILFPITFNADLRWVVKIPVNGTEDKWDELSASALTSEANAMQLLKRETTIPLPEVLDFSRTTQNSLRCPYIVMTFISGMPLYDVWFGNRVNGTDPETTRARRVRALEAISSAMLQLDKFSFPTSGRPLFGGEGNLSGVGNMRLPDHEAMLDRWFINEDPSDDPIYVEGAPSRDPKAYYTHMLDIHPTQEPFPKGVMMLLRELISWIPSEGGIGDHADPAGTLLEHVPFSQRLVRLLQRLFGWLMPSPSKASHPFVLAHPDFDIQNFIVSPEGELLSIIDWDGISFVPRTLGNQRYPSWLTRDWDPGMYGYQECTDQDAEPECVWEDSPESLAYYRRVYHDIMARRLAEAGRASEARLCRMSLVAHNLAIAADDPHCRNGILRKMVDEIWAAAGDDGEVNLIDLAPMFAENNVDAAVMERLRKGFGILLSREGL